MTSTDRIRRSQAIRERHASRLREAELRSRHVTNTEPSLDTWPQKVDGVWVASADASTTMTMDSPDDDVIHAVQP